MASTAFFWAMACFILTAYQLINRLTISVSKNNVRRLYWYQRRRVSPGRGRHVRRVDFSPPSRRFLLARGMPGRPSANVACPASPTARHAMRWRLPAGRIAEPRPKPRPMELDERMVHRMATSASRLPSSICLGVKNRCVPCGPPASAAAPPTAATIDRNSDATRPPARLADPCAGRPACRIASARRAVRSVPQGDTLRRPCPVSVRASTRQDMRSSPAGSRPSPAECRRTAAACPRRHTGPFPEPALESSGPPGTPTPARMNRRRTPRAPARSTAGRCGFRVPRGPVGPFPASTAPPGRRGPSR